MTAIDSETMENIENSFAAVAPTPVALINSYLEVGGVFKNLLEGRFVTAVSIRRDEREIKSDEPFYLRRIEVHGENVDSTFQGLELVAIGLDGKRVPLVPVKRVTKAADGSNIPYVVYMAKTVVRSIAAKSKLSFRSLKLTKVDVYGYSLSQLDAIAKRVTQTVDLAMGVDDFVSRSKSEYTELESRKESLDAEVKESEESLRALAAQKVSLESEVASVNREKDQAAVSLEKVQQQVAGLERTMSAVQSNKEQLDQTAATLNIEISKKRDDLQQLVNDRSLISDEYRDFVKEGRGQARLYVLLATVPAVILAFSSWQLYTGAQRLLATETATNAELLALILQRIPFAAALALIVGICWKLIAGLVARVMHIHSERLTLARLLVIAKDTVYSSATGLAVSDEEKFRERIKLKVDMLKAHLISELGAQFQHSFSDPKIVGSVQNEVGRVSEPEVGS